MNGLIPPFLKKGSIPTPPNPFDKGKEEGKIL
jgi:hypothetical protein